MVSGANKMSLMHWYRQMTESKTTLQKKLEASEKTNRILLEEIKLFKKLVYDLEIEYTVLLKRK